MNINEHGSNGRVKLICQYACSVHPFHVYIETQRSAIIPSSRLCIMSIRRFFLFFFLISVSSVLQRLLARGWLSCRRFNCFASNVVFVT